RADDPSRPLHDPRGPAVCRMYPRGVGPLVSGASARLFCERLVGPSEPRTAARWLRGEPGAVALSGEWAGGGLILTSHPLVVADPEREDPFELLERGTPLDVPVASATAGRTEWDTVALGGGWFGWLGFGLSGLIEELPAPPPRPEPLPPFQLAFHDHLVRCDAQGRWSFEALWSEQRDPFLRERLAVWRERLASPAPGAPVPDAGVTPGPLRAAGSGEVGHAAAVAEAIARIAAGDLSQVNICMRFDGRLPGGDPLELWLAGVAASNPARAAYLAGDGYA